jgi:hypothetical protein
VSGLRILTTSQLRAVVDLDRGAEIAALTHVPSSTGLLLRTPWADEAERIRPVPPASSADSGRTWTETYAGGWQVLFPHAGPPALVDGEERGYHGESSMRAWTLVDEAPDRLRAEVKLHGVALHLLRTISIDGEELRVTDVLTNESARPVRYIYQHHPALGAPFLEAGCRVELPRARVVIETAVGAGPGDPQLARMPARDGSRLFAGLEDLSGRWARVVNPRLGLAVSLTWQHPDLAYAWYWREAGATVDPPWSGRGYTLGIEPSTTPPGTAALRLLTLAAGASRTYEVALSVEFFPSETVSTSEVSA